MSHDRPTTSDAHRELDEYGRQVLVAMVNTWQDPFPQPEVLSYRLDRRRYVRVVRDDLFEFGTKARAVSAVLHQPVYGRADTIVYVAPRAGWAPISLTKVARIMGKRVILFCPAAKELSQHQRAAYELGAELRFVKIAAMPVLQRYAKDFAKARGYTFFPLGLAVPGAVAGLAKVAVCLDLGKVEEVWCVMSTGVLSRALQVAWPKARHFGVAVARNLHEGEKGVATVLSHPLPFLKDAPFNERPPYPSATNYDAKAWKFVVSNASNNAVVWNVAGELSMTFKKKPPISARAWGDLSDLEKP